MLIKAGFDITFECPFSTPMVLMVSVHPERRADLLGEDALTSTPAVPTQRFEDRFGNLCHRLTAPAGLFNIATSFTISDPGRPDPALPGITQTEVADLPHDALTFLAGSRYCETDLMMSTAWSLFGATPAGWARVQAICDFVNRHLTFGYEFARNTRSAAEAFRERVGVCRDFAHLAATFCRCMNIPARYCNGYLGDIGVPPDPAPMDFNAWLEVYLDGRWHVFDARHNIPRIGRIPVARGLDASDTAMVTAFGSHGLRKFQVITEEIVAPPGPHVALPPRDLWEAAESRPTLAA
jgi:transglutaminase-like putative cysteine protease